MAGTAAALGVALGLVVAKLIAWRVTGSAAVLGSFADSLLDVLGSGVAVAAVRYAARPADDDHRFGHQKAEALSALVQSLVITGSALFVAYESVQRLILPEPLAQPQVAVWVLAGAAAVTVALVAFQTLAVRRSGSLVVEGDRAHYAGDVIANLGALVAVLLSARFGFLRADAIAGLLAAAFLLNSVRQIVTRALPQVMDQELPEAERERVLAILHESPDIRGFHDLRTRRAGRRRYIQVHLELDPEMTLRCAHVIADMVEKRLREAFPETDVICHQDLAGQEIPVFPQEDPPAAKAGPEMAASEIGASEAGRPEDQAAASSPQTSSTRSSLPQALR